MKRLSRPYRETMVALVAAGHSPSDLTLPQWARLTLALAAAPAPQRYPALCRQLGIQPASGIVALKWAVASGVIEHCGEGVYRYIGEAPAERQDQHHTSDHG